MNLNNFFEEIGEPMPRKRGPKPGTRQPENIFQAALIDFLKLRDWYVINMTGNEFQMGVPDLYCCHKRHGTRWIEVKVRDRYKFTPAQIDVFPELSAKGVGIWILSASLEQIDVIKNKGDSSRFMDHQYQKLFKPANWWTYLEVMK
jgi:hypothetical protein